ncbi:inositol monophosphatase family protein [Pseudactinotalea sp.]|uniref:inositol monophosphatase family protein n=1 Tax=Pseudactinotalea sp. TaxID=1926260 RepID=UPI003B3B175B
MSGTRELLTFAEDLAREAGAQARAAAVVRAEATTKSSAADWVTPVDRAVEDRIREAILRRYPDHAVIGEEHASVGDPESAEVVWHVDPIDGTTNFLYGLGNVSVSIAALQRDGVDVGVVHDVYRDQSISAARGDGVRIDGSPVVSEPIASLTGAVLLTEWSGHQAWPGMEETLGWVRDQAGAVRIIGSCALALAHAGLGRAAATILPGRYNSWDVAAGLVIAAEGGLRIYGTQGPADGVPADGVLAAAPPVAEPLWSAWRDAAAALA